MDLFERIRTNPDLYYAWQANIAMAFKDEISRSGFVEGDQFPEPEFFHKIANQAAKNFLDLLIKE
jgi:hypothetical protein